MLGRLLLKFGRKSKSENGQQPLLLRWNLIYRISDESHLVSPGDDVNAKYQSRLKYIQKNKLLGKAEKEAAKNVITFDKDYVNLVELKGPTYPCEKCHQQSLTLSCCEHCVRETLRAQFSKWTSGSELVDRVIQECQRQTPLPNNIIEWIPYEDLTDVTYKTQGKSSEIYTATWSKGYIMSFDKKAQKFKRSKPWPVILKKIPNSEQPNQEVITKIRQSFASRTNHSAMMVSCFGVTRDPTTLEYMLVVDTMVQDLHSYIKENYSSLTWKDINYLLWDVANSLMNSHADGVVYKDLDPGSILQSNSGIWYISDFKLHELANQRQSDVYGNLPYIAPEIVRGTQHSTATDIYSIGMIMYHAVTGNAPFANRKYDIHLALDICNGVRPPFANGIPNSLKKLIQQCWDDETTNRPTAEQIFNYFHDECEKTVHDANYGVELVK